MSNQPLYHDTSNLKIYVKFFDQLHWIAGPATMSAVFGPTDQLYIQDSIPSLVAEGFPINEGSCLIKANGGIYLYTNGQKFLIDSVDALTRYQFRGKIYPRDPQDDILAGLALNSIPDGGVIS